MTQSYIARSRDEPAGPVSDGRRPSANLADAVAAVPGSPPGLSETLHRSVGVQTQMRLQRVLDQRAAVEAQARLAASLSGRRPQAAVLQRKLSVAGTSYAKVEDLTGITATNIKSTDRPSRGVRSLVASSDSFFVPDQIEVDLAAPRIRALEDKKYLLGEQHYSQAWEKRTFPWGNIPKMSEAYSRIEEDNEEARPAIAKAEAELADDQALLPLEDTLVKAVTTALILQHVLNTYVRVSAPYRKLLMEKNRKAEKFNKQELLEKTKETVSTFVTPILKPLAYVCEELDDLDKLGKKLANAAKNSPRVKAYTGLADPLDGKVIGSLCEQIREGFKAQENDEITVPEILQRLGETLSVFDVGGLQTGLKAFVDRLLLVRKGSPQFARDASALSIPGAKNSGQWAEAVDPERERIMLARIQGHSPPLLVQLGFNHQQHLEERGLPAGIIAVPKCEASQAGTTTDPFVAMTTWPEREGSWVVPALVGAGLLAAGLGAWLWSRSKAR